VRSESLRNSSAATAVAEVVNWTFSLVVGLTFPILEVTDSNQLSMEVGGIVFAITRMS
jgi:hypothetical protein